MQALIMSYNTTLVPPLRSCTGPACEAGLSTGMWRGHVPTRKERKGNAVKLQHLQSSDL